MPCNFASFILPPDSVLFRCALIYLGFLQLTLAEVWFPPQFHKQRVSSPPFTGGEHIRTVRERQRLSHPHSALPTLSLGSAIKMLVRLHRPWEEKACVFTLLTCSGLEVSWWFLMVFILQKQIQSLNKMCSNLLEKISKEERESESGGRSLSWNWGAGSKQQA